MDYVEYTRGGGCRIIESNISKDRAEELESEIKEFNKENASGAYYRAISGGALALLGFGRTK